MEKSSYIIIYLAILSVSVWLGYFVDKKKNYYYSGIECWAIGAATSIFPLGVLLFKL